MPQSTIALRSIELAALHLDEGRVDFQCTTGAGQPLALSISTQLLPRLIALALHAAGKSEAPNSDEILVLRPESIDILGLAGGAAGLRVVLPGGAPITFQLEAELINSLQSDLSAHSAAIAGPRGVRPN